LADRLALSEAAAQHLLESLGYEPAEHGGMELRIGRDAMRKRDTWIFGESWRDHETFDEDDLDD
jgi:hypothetical protein